MDVVVAYRSLLIGAVFATLCAGCGSNAALTAEAEAEPEAQPAAQTEPLAVISAAEGPVMGGAPAAPITRLEPQTVDPEPIDPCEQDDTEGWLDKSQEWIYEVTCDTAAWFDGFFGSARYDEQTGQTYGRVGLSSFWDQRDGLDAKLRFRGTFALPALNDRAQLMVGKGDAEELIDERSTQWDTIPGNFNNIEDDSFLIGLGYTGKRRTGFKVSVGARIRAPPEPYVKLRYRKHWSLTDTTMIGFRPLVYWKSEEKFGTTVHVDIDQMLTEHMMLRWANYGNVAQGEEVRGVEWESSLFLFQALSNRRALTYRAMILGETDAPEPLTNYGFEFRYRQRIFREWLFLELLTSVTWPKEFIEEDRDANFGIGLGFEMYFGPVPDRQMY